MPPLGRIPLVDGLTERGGVATAAEMARTAGEVKQTVHGISSLTLTRGLTGAL
jgi:hypothetical protein